MRIIALLSWWDERPSRLVRCVTPLGRFCDGLVAIDGPYAATPGAEAATSSPGDQADTIAAAAVSSGLDLILRTSVSPWDSEMAKRTALFQTAGLLGADWVFVLDADEVVQEVPGSLRDQLAATDLDVASVLLADLDGGAGAARRFFRWSPDLHVAGSHFTYVADGKYLWGDSGKVQLAPALPIDGLRLQHQQAEPAEQRRRTQLAYYERRDRLGLEQ